VKVVLEEVFVKKIGGGHLMRPEKDGKKGKGKREGGKSKGGYDKGEVWKIFRRRGTTPQRRESQSGSRGDPNWESAVKCGGSEKSQTEATSELENRVLETKRSRRGNKWGRRRRGTITI